VLLSQAAIRLQREIDAVNGTVVKLSAQQICNVAFVEFAGYLWSVIDCDAVSPISLAVGLPAGFPSATSVNNCMWAIGWSTSMGNESHNSATFAMLCMARRLYRAKKYEIYLKFNHKHHLR
jgi:hypothetical protein